MTAWGVVAVCAVGGCAAGPFLDRYARRVRRPVAPAAAASDEPLPEPAAARASEVGGTPMAVTEGAPFAVGAVGGTSTGEAEAGARPSPRGADVRADVVVALVTAAACALCALRLGAVPQLAAYCVLVGALVVVSITDLRTGLVPRRVVYVAAVVVGAALLCASATNGTWRPMLDALVGGAIAFALFGAVWWISPKAMGFGDVRLAGLCGGALGWLGLVTLYLGFLAGFVAGTLFGVAVLMAHGRHRFPFAPALAIGTMFGVLWGPWLGSLWLHAR